ncbi:MAG: hypothetical protein ACJAYG_002036 [Oceanicoccus sp.]|jgi:hypothetical protein
MRKYYREKIIKLLLCILIMSSSPIIAGEFKAGISTVAITPVAHKDIVNTLEAGPKTVGNISDPLYAKAMVLSDGHSHIGLITLDLMYIPPLTFAELLKDLRLQSTLDQIFLSITHSHSGYVGNSNYDALRDKLIAAIKTAEANLQPVKIGAAEATLNESYNRIIRHSDSSAEMLWTNPDRKENRDVDQSVGIINLKKLNGETLVNIVNYNAHPVVTMDLNNVVISADYPGQLAKSLRQSGEGETLFFLGAAGDINPYFADTKPTALALEKSKELGEKIASEVVANISGITDYQTQGRFSFNNFRYSLPVIKKSELDVVPAEINTLLLTGDIALASFSGEFFDQFSVMVKQQSPAKHTFFLGYTNGYIGYIPTEEAVQFGGYGADSNDMWLDVGTGQKQVSDAIDSLRTLHEKQKVDH